MDRSTPDDATRYGRSSTAVPQGGHPMSGILFSLALASALLTSGVAQAAGEVAPVVAVTVRPLHSLVAAVMAGIGKPDLVITGTARAGDYKPAAGEADRLATARL